jgi:DHA3 family macrolide efflux protein-like MFS transporter
MSPRISGMRAFYVIWFGQLISTLGSSLTGFAMGVWIYQRTDSVTLFAINTFIFMGVTVAVSPFAGALVDRWNRRWVMILADAGAGLTTVIIWLLLLTGNLQIWQILVIGAFNAAFTSFQFPAHSAATTMLVPREQLGRAGGMVQISQAISNLVAPALAGYLFVAIGLEWILVIDIATFLVAVITLFIIHVPEPERSEENQTEQSTIFKEIRFGWNYITQRKGLLYWMLYIAALNLGAGLAFPLLTPLMLDLGDAQQVGLANSGIGLGMLLGTLIMSAWGGPKRRVYAVLGSGLWLGVFMMFIGARPSLLAIGIAGFFLMIALPILNGSSRAMWQTKVPPDIQGRVFSVRRVIGQFTNPLAALAAGPLVENLLQPMMEEGGALSGSFGRLIGVGDGRGTALMFVLVGIFIILVTLYGFSNRTLVNTEIDNPDAEIIERQAQPQPVR